MKHNNFEENQESIRLTDDVGKKPVIGVVTNCLKLNIRKNPTDDAEVLLIIPALTKVLVDIDASTDQFYKVCTKVGIDGFCTKKYIALRR